MTTTSNRSIALIVMTKLYHPPHRITHPNFRSSKSAMLLSFWTRYLDHYAASSISVRKLVRHHCAFHIGTLSASAYFQPKRSPLECVGEQNQGEYYEPHQHYSSRISSVAAC